MNKAASQDDAASLPHMLDLSLDDVDSQDKAGKEGEDSLQDEGAS